MQSLLLALLVGDGARGLAGRLAGGLALAAAAFYRGFLQILMINRLNMLHDMIPP